MIRARVTGKGLAIAPGMRSSNAAVVYCIWQYSSYVCMYYSDMTRLLNDHPDVHAFMEAGALSVQMISVNSFWRIPVD